MSSLTKKYIYLIEIRSKNVEIKNIKDQFINCCFVLCLCIVSFCTGKFIRFERISGTSEQLISGIVQAGDNTDQIVNELIIAGASTESANRYGTIISGIIKELRDENEQLGISTDEAIRAIESNKRVTELVKSASSNLHETTGTALELAIKRAEDYERLIESLQEALRNTAENNK